MKNWIWNADNGDGTYRNPILYTDYSDPDVVRVGKDYYLVASSFCNTPALPVLHSKDLVNWTMLSYVLEQIDEPGYEKPQHGHGVWAPSIRYHEGYFYVYYPMPDEGIFMCKAKDAAGPWSEPVCVKAAKGWIDPCPLWDDDGRAWLVNAFAKSRSGIKSILHISPMSPDGECLLDEGVDVFDGHNTQPTIEGPKFYKRNGYYYILAPAGGVKTGWQTALRSRNVYGPYEEKIVMMQGDSAINGPHQGGWTTTPSGEDWFIHFQDVGNAGRIVHLQPMRWENDWPVIGKDTGEGYGVPVAVYRKPDCKPDSNCAMRKNSISVAGTDCIVSPDDSDDFAGNRLGLQWQWNANHKSNWYHMEQPGLRLFAQPYSGPLCDAPHLLLQKWTAPAFTVRVEFDTSDLLDQDTAGFVSFGRFYTALIFEKENGSLCLTRVSGTIGGSETTVRYGIVPSGRTEVAMQVFADGNGQFYFPDVTGVWRTVGERFSFTPGVWVGAKYGLFASHEGHTQNDASGSLKVLKVEVRTDTFIQKCQPES
ncbi:MAG: glycoside hydrolase 43 family protein [Lachnospiraceae bacterium]|nr:glycoside hydrolase 43 family protein [Lachnospiraceae bacterium]